MLLVFSAEFYPSEFGEKKPLGIKSLKNTLKREQYLKFKYKINHHSSTPFIFLPWIFLIRREQILMKADVTCHLLERL